MRNIVFWGSDIQNPFTRSFLIFLISLLIFFSCGKKSETKSNTELELNTWTFTVGSTIYSGKTYQSKTLIPRDVNSQGERAFVVVGYVETIDNVFQVGLNLRDTTFSIKNYVSGVTNAEKFNHFAFAESLASPKIIFRSADYVPGAKMNYTISSFDKSRSVVTITFSGQAFDANGNKVAITDGKLTVAVIVL